MEAATTTDIEALTGEALDNALEARGLLEGNKSKSADDKRDLLRKAEAEAEAEASKSGEVTVAVGYPHHEFESQVDDVPTITSAGVTIPRGKLDAVKEVAKTYEVPLVVKR